MEELDPIKLKAELDQFKKEKEKIRQLMGQIGGKDAEKKDRIVNWVFMTAILLIAVNDMLHHVFHIPTPIETDFSIGLAILLVSIKIIWMMHKATKVEHFQFWIIQMILKDTKRSPSSMENSGARGIERPKR